jgi:hypothetical protein
MWYQLVLWLLCSIIGCVLVWLACSKRHFERLFLPAIEANRRLTQRAHWPTASVKAGSRSFRIALLVFGLVWTLVSFLSVVTEAKQLF